MFDDVATSTADLAGMVAALQRLDRDVDDSTRIDQIRALEELKSAAAAAQALVTTDFVASQQAIACAAGVPREDAGRGVARQVALARRLSPHRAQREVGWAAILTAELPNTFAALAAGRTTEWRAILVARETAWLSREHRLTVDAELASSLEGLGDRGVEREARRIAYRLDPLGAAERMRNAERDRRVTLRPVPDTMAGLTAVLPLVQGVACYAALRREADGRIAEGDLRSRGQIMADTLVERVTGQQTATDVPVEVNLVMTDVALLGCGDGAECHAEVDGYGPLPAEVAREIVKGSGRPVPRWIRRLYRHPQSGELIAMESRRRLFTAGQRRFIQVRDQICRTPWCDAPIRHVDHVVPHNRGGPTTVENGEGYCAACNYAKEAPGWSARPYSGSDGRHRVVVTTPTGRQYVSEPPRLVTALSRAPIPPPALLRAAQ